jgi:hypothetical protein
VLTNLEFVHAAPVPPVGAAERGRTSGLAPAHPRHPNKTKSSICGGGGIKAAKARALFIINNFDSVPAGTSVQIIQGQIDPLTKVIRPERCV